MDRRWFISRGEPAPGHVECQRIDPRSGRLFNVPERPRCNKGEGPNCGACVGSTAGLVQLEIFQPVTVPPSVDDDPLPW